MLKSKNITKSSLQKSLTEANSEVSLAAFVLCLSVLDDAKLPSRKKDMLQNFKMLARAKVYAETQYI